MKVFIWKAYGNIELYAIETQEQRAALADSLEEVLANCDAEDFDSEGMTDDQRFWELVDRAVEQSEYDNDMFESGSGIAKITE